MVSHSDKDHPEAGNGLTIVDYEDLQRLDDDTLQLLSNAFVGTAAYGVVGIRGVPGYRESRKGAFEKAVTVAVHDSAARQQFAGVRQTLEWNSWQGGTPSPVQFLAQHQRRSRKLSGPGARDYRGEVFADKFNNKFRPIRDPAHRNYLSTAHYSPEFLPRYATGNFYMLSVDLVHYIASNAESLLTIGSLEDVSIAMWLARISVAPIYSHGVLAYDEVIDKMIGEGIVTDGMVIPAGSTLCEELFCIYYVKTPSVLNKVVKHFSQCANSHIPILDDFESTSSASPSRYILHLKSNKRSNGLVHQHENTAVRQHQHQQPLDNDLLVIYVTYQSAWSFEIIRSLLTDSYPTQNLLFYLVQSTDNVEANEGRLYVLPPAAYAEIESTAESVSEEKFVRRRPDIFVISSVDERKGDNTRTQLCHSKSNEGIIRDSTSLQQSDKLLSWHFNCQDYIRESIEEIDPKNILFINGEAVDVTTTSTFLGHQNDEVGNKGKQYNRKYVILNAYNVDKIKGRIDDTSTRRNRNDARDKEHKGEIVVQYLPNAATSLASAPVYRHSDMQLFSDTSSEDSILFANKAAWLLLETRGGEWAANVLSEKKRSVAYLYFRCDRPDRELFFSLLFPLLPTVDSLGACSGSGRSSDQAAKDSRGYIEARFASNYIGQAIHAYKPYKFVIAFENTLVDGYITEKLTNAFLSHSVPIYYGAPDVGKYFNTQAFINCHDFLDLQSCASYVAKVNEDETLYLSYLQAPPMTSVEVWCDFFQALPGVARDRRCQRHLEKSDNDNNIVRNIVNTFDFHAP